MVGPARFYPKDPQGRGRGPGLYWHRGKGVYSKRDLDLDALRVAVKGRWKDKRQAELYPHKADFYTGRMDPKIARQALVEEKLRVARLLRRISTS